MSKDKIKDSQKNWLIALLILILIIAVYFIFFNKKVLLGPEEDKKAFQEAINLNQQNLDTCNNEKQELENRGADEEEIQEKQAECDEYQAWINFYDQKIKDMDNAVPIQEPLPEPSIEFKYASADDPSSEEQNELA